MSTRSHRRNAQQRWNSNESASPQPPPGNSGSRLDDLAADLRHTARTFVTAPGFAAIVILTLALGVGATTAIFSVVNGAILEPLPYGEPDDLLFLHEQIVDRGSTISVSYPNFMDWRAQNGAFVDLAAFNFVALNLTGLGDPQRLTVCRFSAGGFEILGVEPQLGRGFRAEEDAVEGQRVAVLSHVFWRHRMGGDPDVLGRSVSLDGLPYTVVGVMPEGFVFPDLRRRPEIWVPIEQFAANWIPQRGNHPGITVIGRTRPGITLEQARADMDTVAAALSAAYPETNGDIGVRVRPFYERLVGPYAQGLWILFVAVASVLLIACVNVANLMLARGSARRAEMAIRAALGASRGRVVRLLLVESMVLWLAGGLVGLGVARLGMDVLGYVLVDLVPSTSEAAIDGRALAFALLTALLTGVVFGLVPALRATASDPGRSLRGTGRTSASAVRRRGRRQLVMAEFALAQALLIVAGIAIHSFSLLITAPTGIDTENVLTARISLPDSRYADDPLLSGFLERLHGRLEALPGVTSVSLSNTIPMSGRGRRQSGYSVEGEPPVEGQLSQLVETFAVSPEYFGTLGIPLRRGRLLDDRDGAGSRQVAVIDETFAARHWPGEDPIGGRFCFGSPDADAEWIEVVGVVGHVKDRGAASTSLVEAYLHFEAELDNEWAIALRTEGDPLALTDPLRQAVLELDAGLPISDVAPLEQYVADTASADRTQSALLGSFAAAALLLAALGVYGVMSHDTHQRTKEIGIRMAIGASKKTVLRQVVRQALVPVAVGSGCGLMLALVIARWMASEMYGVSFADPLAFVAAPIFLGSVAVLASYAPARRASRVDPIVALRGD